MIKKRLSLEQCLVMLDLAGRRPPSVWDKCRAALDRECVQKDAGDESERS